MPYPLTELIALGLRHIAEEPTASRRAAMLDAAAEYYRRIHPGNAALPEKMETTAALIRSADEAQLVLIKCLDT